MRIVSLAAIMMVTALMSASPVLAVPTSTVTVTVVDGKNTKETTDDTKYTATVNKGQTLTDGQLSKIKTWANSTEGRSNVVKNAYTVNIPNSIKNKFNKNTTIKLTYKQTKPIVNFIDSRTKKTFLTKVGETGKTIDFPNAPEHAGYVFTKWTGLSQDKTLSVKTYKVTANYKEKKLKIVFDGNGASNQNAMKTVEIAYSKNYTLPKNKFTRDGYIFSGWRIKSKDYDEGAKLSFSTSDGDSVTVQAVWFKPKSYTIDYVLNGGYFEKEPVKQYSKYSKTFSLPTPKSKEKFGEVFVGWTGEGLNRITKKVTIKNGSTGDRKFYAVWRPATSSMKGIKKTSLGKVEIKATMSQGIGKYKTHRSCSISEGLAKKYNLRVHDDIQISTTNEIFDIVDFTGVNTTLFVNVIMNPHELSYQEYNKTATIYKVDIENY